MTNTIFSRSLASIVLLLLVSCSSSGSGNNPANDDDDVAVLTTVTTSGNPQNPDLSYNDDDGVTPLFPLDNTPGNPQNPDLLYTAPSINNGYYLSTKSTISGSGDFDSKSTYVLDTQNMTLSRFDGDTPEEGQLDVVYTYNSTGLIVSKKNLTISGEALQTFNTRYDERNRIFSSQSFNGDEPFLSTVYRYTGLGPIEGKTVTYTTSGDAFSQVDYQYGDNGVLLNTSTTSPLLANSALVNTFMYSSDGMQLELVEDQDGDRTTFEYDVNGNVSSEKSYNSSGLLQKTIVYEYTATDLAIPNLPLHEIVYEVEQR